MGEGKGGAQQSWGRQRWRGEEADVFLQHVHTLNLCMNAPLLPTGSPTTELFAKPLQNIVNVKLKVNETTTFLSQHRRDLLFCFRKRLIKILKKFFSFYIL